MTSKTGEDMSETAQTYKNYIGGEWVAAADGRTTENHDPASGALLGHFPRSAQADVDRAVAAAKTAFEGWRRTPAPKRGEMLYRVGALLTERKEEIARILTSEMGKVLVEARGDVQEAIDMAYYMAGEGRRLFGAIVPSELPNKAAYGVRDRDSKLEEHGGAHRREHRGPQASDRHAALGAETSRGVRRRRAAAGRAQPGDGQWLGGGHAAGPAS
jgi:aldehyde dehydrogenase family protein